MKGLVFDMQHYSLHDGPGIRTLVFLKGCPLSCLWCSNPESQSLENEIMVINSDCIGLEKCGLCKAACSQGGIAEDQNGNAVIDRNRCNGCGLCSGSCPGIALQNTNVTRSVEDVVTYVMEEEDFYRKSGGGVTLSGGEPMYQYQFCLALLRAFKEKKLHVAMETTVCCSKEKLEEAAKYVDFFLIDIKSMDSEIHKKYTGKENRNILENIKLLNHLGKDIEIRVPLIPGINDSRENLEATAAFISSNIKDAKVTLLLYHRLGNLKYEQLGKQLPLAELLPIKINENANYLEIRKDIFQSYGVEVTTD